MTLLQRIDRIEEAIKSLDPGKKLRPAIFLRRDDPDGGLTLRINLETSPMTDDEYENLVKSLDGKNGFLLGH